MARPRKKTPEIEAKQGYPGRRRSKTKAEIAVLDAATAVGEADGDAKRPARVPPAPEWLPEDARKLWATLGADLVRRQIVKTPGEWLAFERYIQECWLWRQLWAECVTPKGRLRTVQKVATAAGGTMKRANPAFGQLRQTAQALKDYEDRYGLNPQARTALLLRIGDPKKPPRGDAPGAGADAPPTAGAPAKPGSPLGILTAKRLN